LKYDDRKGILVLFLLLLYTEAGNAFVENLLSTETKINIKYPPANRGFFLPQSKGIILDKRNETFAR